MHAKVYNDFVMQKFILELYERVGSSRVG